MRRFSPTVGLTPLFPQSMTMMITGGKRLQTTSSKTIQSRIGEIEATVDKCFTDVLRPVDTLQFFAPTAERCRIPMVMMLGNHSSGKSTLINSLLGESCKLAQATGVAPTDDGFTVIMRGERDIDEDGPTAVSNPTYGFEGLRGYGQSMFSHFKVKTRKLQDGTTFLPSNLMLIDTPGMIDTPARVGGTGPASERGYDFLGVVKWFATRCDVVLLMFDPSNPGTTGETLDVLTKSLKGLEHKFIIVFNKVDVFEKVPDFARCYGALCWNLSKVIDRKDLPRIYTMYTDVGTNQNTSAVMCKDFKETRKEVIRDVLRAPVRRIDNVITELDSAARYLHMCSHMVNVLKSKARKRRVQTYSVVTSLVCGVPAAIAFGVSTFGTGTPVLAASAFTLCTAVGIASVLISNLNRFIDDLVKEMDTVFLVEYHVSLQGENKADVEDCWSVVRTRLLHVFKNNIKTLRDMSTTSRSNLMALDNIIKKKVPELRSLAHDLKMTMDEDTMNTNT